MLDYLDEQLDTLADLTAALDLDHPDARAARRLTQRLRSRSELRSAPLRYRRALFDVRTLTGRLRRVHDLRREPQ